MTFCKPTPSEPQNKPMESEHVNLAGKGYFLGLWTNCFPIDNIIKITLSGFT